MLPGGKIVVVSGLTETILERLRFSFPTLRLRTPGHVISHEMYMDVPQCSHIEKDGRRKVVLAGGVFLLWGL